jgi:N-carbamoyl-L-amino-acid hydrolase
MTRSATPGDRDVLAELRQICERRGLRLTPKLTMRAAAAPSAPAWQQRWERAVDSLGVPLLPHAQRRRPRRHETARGDAPGHAVRARPERGISHNPLESTTSDDMQLCVQAFSTCWINLATWPNTRTP